MHCLSCWLLVFDGKNARIAAANYFFLLLLSSIYCCFVDLQMAGDKEQQIPAISVPMPGKDGKIKSLTITTGTILSSYGTTAQHYVLRAQG